MRVHRLKTMSDQPAAQHHDPQSRPADSLTTQRQAADTSGADSSPTVRAEDGRPAINFHTRKWVRPEDLNANGTLFGGSLLRWIDDEAVVYAMIQLGNQRIVTKFISEINFVASATQGDIIEIGLTAVKFGRTSLTMACQVRNIITGQIILEIDKIVFVGLDEDGEPLEHGYTTITYDRDRFPEALRNR